MKLNSKNKVAIKVLALASMLSIDMVAMEAKPEPKQKKESNTQYFPFVNFVNKTQYPVNILLQSVQYYMSKPYTLEPGKSIVLDLSEKTAEGKNAPIQNLKMGYATGVSSYGPMQDISKITSDINSYLTREQLYYISKQQTLHLKVFVEILEDKSGWKPSLKYQVKITEIGTKGLDKDITKGSEDITQFDIAKEKIGAQSLADLDQRFINAIKALEKKIPAKKMKLVGYSSLFEKYKKDGDLEAAKNLVLSLEADAK